MTLILPLLISNGSWGSSYYWNYSADFEDSTSYQDFENSTYAENIFYNHFMVDYIDEQFLGFHFNSVVRYTGLDCRNMISTPIWIEFYSGNMGEGDVVYKDIHSKEIQKELSFQIKPNMPAYQSAKYICTTLKNSELKILKEEGRRKSERNLITD